MLAQPSLELPALIELLRKPCAYPHPIDTVRVIQTHISYVLLAGAYAYKIKKPVDFGFLDFRSLRRRRHFCQREVTLNARLAPGLYLGVVPVVRQGTQVRVGLPVDDAHRAGESEVIEYAVMMRRLPEDGMMETLLAAGRVPAESVERVARKLVDFHGAARSGPKVVRFGSPDEIFKAWQQNLDQTAAWVGTTHSLRQRELLTEYMKSAQARLLPVLWQRMRTRHIREGHGDLRVSAVCFDRAFPDGLGIFDCIEFNQRFRCCDVTSEVAFLAMDLELHGRPDLASRFVDAYVAAGGSLGPRALLPFYECYRAHVRAKVEGFRAREPEVGASDRAQALRLARDAFALACRFAEIDRPALLVLMSGLSATGKTTLAQALATRRPFKVISSDWVRKELAGVALTHRWAVAPDSGPYSPERKQAVYAELHRRAAVELGSGHSVILDATFGLRAQREAMRALAAETGAYFLCLECRADEGAVRTRMDEREQQGSVSDARLDIYLRQRAGFEPLDGLAEWNHVVVHTSGPLEGSVKAALAALDERLTSPGDPPSA